jgi:hypothetical protein
MSLKKLPAIVTVRSKFAATVWNVWNSQPVDFTGQTPPQTLWNRTCKQERVEAVGGDATMRSTFDIFKVTSEGPLWVDAVHGLEEAKERMGRLALTSPGEYFIHSQEQGIVAQQTQEFSEEIS